MDISSPPTLASSAWTSSMVSTSLALIWVITSPSRRPQLLAGVTFPPDAGIWENPTTSTPSEKILMPTARPTGITRRPAAPPVMTVSPAARAMGAPPARNPSSRQAASTPRKERPVFWPVRPSLTCSISYTTPEKNEMAQKRAISNMGRSAHRHTGNEQRLWLGAFFRRPCFRLFFASPGIFWHFSLFYRLLFL